MMWLLLLVAQTLPQPSQVIALRAELGHVQGIEIGTNRLWVTDVDTHNKRGYLRIFSLPDGELLKTVDVTDGDRYHPGGIMAGATDIWIPVAEYRRESSSVIQRRDRRTLELISSFPVADHIGAVALLSGDRLLGANWDAKKFYTWGFDGHQLSVRDSPTGTAFQDLKVQAANLIGGGIREGEGAIEWIDLNTWSLKKRLSVGRTDRNVRFTQEGMAVDEGKLYLLPEDGKSRLFVFDLPRVD